MLQFNDISDDDSNDNSSAITNVSEVNVDDNNIAINLYADERIPADFDDISSDIDDLSMGFFQDIYAQFDNAQRSRNKNINHMLAALQVTEERAYCCNLLNNQFVSENDWEVGTFKLWYSDWCSYKNHKSVYAYLNSRAINGPEKPYNRYLLGAEGRNRFLMYSEYESMMGTGTIPYLVWFTLSFWKLPTDVILKGNKKIIDSETTMRMLDKFMFCLQDDMFDEFSKIFLKPIWMINFLNICSTILDSLLSPEEMKLVSGIVSHLTKCISIMDETDGNSLSKNSWTDLKEQQYDEELSTMFTLENWKPIEPVLKRLKEKVPKEDYCSSFIIPKTTLNTSTSSTTARGTADPVIATTSGQMETNDDLEDVLFGPTTSVEQITGPILQNICTYQANEVSTVTSEAPSTKYAVLLRVINMDKVRKMEKKDFWKGRVKEIFSSVPSNSPTSRRLGELIASMQDLVQKGPNMTTEVKPIKSNPSWNR